MPSIVYLFSQEFTLLIGIALVLAAPLSYLFMRQWLDENAGRFEF